MDVPESHPDQENFGAVVIGRNEAERLPDCLRSLSGAARLVYVDSGSNDGSPDLARRLGAEVLELDRSAPFSAARGRNAGFRLLKEIAPDLSYVQFVDGDCVVADSWPARALSFLKLHKEAGAVSGTLRERYPERSIYNWLCDREWNGPVGEVRYCGGIVMMRSSALEAVGGYREDVVAGEEPELCVRLRGAGWSIWRLDADMAMHDAAMLQFGQWWRRTLRGGYAFAQGAHLHGAKPERFWVWESRRAWLWGVVLPLVCAATTFIASPWGWAAWLIYPLQVLRQTVRNPGTLNERAALAFFQVLARLPEGLGQIKFMYDRLRGRHACLIEYK